MPRRGCELGLVEGVLPPLQGDSTPNLPWSLEARLEGFGYVSLTRTQGGGGYA
jgi:hypothetical protein